MTIFITGIDYGNEKDFSCKAHMIKTDGIKDVLVTGNITIVTWEDGTLTRATCRKLERMAKKAVRQT